jgi:hypothetical protein
MTFKSGRLHGNFKHGQSSTKLHYPSKSYYIWQSMISRCYNPNHKSYDRYGGRGITVCESWRLEFKEFLSDMGPPPEGKQLDRIDNNLGYSPQNCRWVTAKQNGNNRNNNRKIECDGITHTLAEWSQLMGINITTLHKRLSYGWSAKDALTRPLRKDKRRLS